MKHNYFILSLLHAGKYKAETVPVQFSVEDSEAEVAIIITECDTEEFLAYCLEESTREIPGVRYKLDTQSEFFSPITNGEDLLTDDISSILVSDIEGEQTKPVPITEVQSECTATFNRWLLTYPSVMTGTGYTIIFIHGGIIDEH